MTEWWGVALKEWVNLEIIELCFMAQECHLLRVKYTSLFTVQGAGHRVQIKEIDMRIQSSELFVEN